MPRSKLRRRKHFDRGHEHPAPEDERHAAIRAAADVTGACAEDIIAGKFDDGRMDRRVLYRARAYAALALRALYPDNNQSSYALWVLTPAGVRMNFMTNIDRAIRENRLNWWSDEKFMHVIETVERFQEEKKKTKVIDECAMAFDVKETAK